MLPKQLEIFCTSKPIEKKILGLLLRENIWTQKFLHPIDQYDKLLVVNKKIMLIVSSNKKQ